MPDYIVYRKETHFCPVKVTADTMDEAVRDVQDGGGDDQDTQYFDTESDGWRVCEAPADGSTPDHEDVTQRVESLDEDEEGGS